jgi:hypothetical protein
MWWSTAVLKSHLKTRIFRLSVLQENQGNGGHELVPVKCAGP